MILLVSTRQLQEGLTSVHNSKAQPTMTGKAWRQGQEAAGHSVSRVRKQRETNAGTLLTVSFSFRLGLHSVGWGCPHLGWVFLLQLNLSRNTIMDS